MQDMKSPSMSLGKLTVIAFLLATLQGCGSGQLNGAAVAYLDNDIAPLLRQAGYCQSASDCYEHRKLLVASTDKRVKFIFYQMSDRRLIAGVTNKLMQADFDLVEGMFFAGTESETGMFDKPIASVSIKRATR